jgi:hypothetical protein
VVRDPSVVGPSHVGRQHPVQGQAMTEHRRLLPRCGHHPVDGRVEGERLADRRGLLAETGPSTPIRLRRCNLMASSSSSRDRSMKWRHSRI